MKKIAPARANKQARLRRATAGKPSWTDGEVLTLVDAVLVARDAELKDRIGNVLGSRYGVGADRESELVYAKGIGSGEWDSLGRRLGQALAALEEDPARRGQIKSLVAGIGRDLALGRATVEAARSRHRVSA